MKKMEEDEERCCDHASDCAVHNAPGLPVGECDCGVEAWKSVDKLRELIPLARRAPVELEAKVEEVARHLNRVLPRR